MPLASPRGLKEAVGVTVLVESMKLREAQKIPERTLLSSFQDLSTSVTVSWNQTQSSAPDGA